MDIRAFFDNEKPNKLKNNTKKILVIEENEEFNELLELYKNCDYIPSNIIPKLLILSMPSCEIIHTYTNYHLILKVKVNDLLNTSISNWEYNRPPDLTRCYDIAKYIYSSKTPLDTMLYFNFNNKKRSFDVIDGIHRFTSLKLIKQYNSKPLDLITPSDFGNNNDAKWLYDSYIIINLRITANEGELIELFKNLNKSSPIPDLYIRDTTKDKREIIESIVNNWQNKYKQHFSSHCKPNKPNVNRDRFIELLDTIYTKYNITNETKYILEQKLDNANINISYNMPKRLTQSIKDKCNRSGCWLFINSIDELINII